MRSPWIRVGLKSIESPFERQKRRHRDTGEQPLGTGSQKWSHAAIAQERPLPPEAGRGEGRFFTLEGEQFFRHLDFRCLVSRTMKE